MHCTLAMVFLAATGTCLGACKERNPEPPSPSPSEAAKSESETKPLQPSETAKAKAAYALAGPLCTKLTRHQVSLSTSTKEIIDESWDEAIIELLATCMTSDYTPEDVRCMSTAVTIQGYRSCVNTRPAEAALDE